MTFDTDTPNRWPLDPGALLPRERWQWYQRTWDHACALRARYRLPVRQNWWESPIAVEAIAALAAWVDRYASGEWDDPPGKLTLLYEIERVGNLLRDGPDPFHPGRDLPAFERFLIETAGC